MKARFLLVVSILLLSLISCSNGFKLDDSEFRDIGDFTKPEDDLPTGVETFTRNFSYPNFTGEIEETDLNTSFLKLTNIDSKETSLVVTLKLDGLVDNEFGNVKVTAEYSPLDSNSASFVKKMTFDRYGYMVFSKNLGNTEYDPSEASVEITLDTSVSPQAGYITFSFDYAESVYNQGEEFKEFTMFISAYGVNKPSFALADIVEKDESIAYFKADKKILLLDKTLEKSQESFTSTYTARFAGVVPGKPLTASVASKTDGIEVGNFVNNDDGTINFDVTYNTKALMFEDIVDTFTLNLVPSAGSEEYYDNNFSEVDIEARRNKAFVFYKPSLSASAMAEKKAEMIDGVTKYFTELTLPAQNTIENPDVTYTLYRKDDRSAEFIKIADIPSPINSEVIYKDYDGLAITNAEQDYKVIITLNGESSLESDVVKGSRMLTEREMGLAVINSIRYGFIDKNSHNSNKSINGENGGTLTNDRSYDWLKSRQDHTYTFNNYKPFLFTLSGTIKYSRNGVDQSSINTTYDDGTSDGQPFKGTINISSDYENGSLTFNSININNNTWSNPSWQDGTLDVSFGENTISYNKDTMRFAFYNTWSEFIGYVAPDGVYTQK